MNPDPSEQSPKYCDYFKHLLVEEIALVPDYRQLHYGKCAVSGVLGIETDGFKLQNLRLVHLPCENTLPAETLSVRLLNINYEIVNSEKLADGSPCIVRGEVVLCNVLGPGALMTARGIHELYLESETERDKLMNYLEKTYKPAINVWFIKRINQAVDLTERKLEIRLLCDEKDCS
ncbi:uncharacterized protein LOC115624065 [Scaptodrosophila lebanonensis]|uniref:Uncharacterized protein LOC115624065 n=1 Tax=Drosophila lebanonensis TaxID=7225 RepID=A0A6J2TGE1_DROLE|nr:uncharacterized protein LOC115624065 [Scaptodrosophila lebanonensis]